MIVVDTSALVAVLKGEPDAQVFADAVTKDVCLISSVSLLETSIVLAGRNGGAPALRPLDELIEQLKFQVRPHDAALTEIARQAFLRFGKGRHPAKLNFGDCAAYALAKSEGLALLFKGGDFAKTDITAAV